VPFPTVRYAKDYGWVTEWFKAPVLTKSATADLGREPKVSDPSVSEDGKQANACFPQSLRTLVAVKPLD